MNIDVLTLAQHVTAFLESPYKPFLMIIPFAPWAWIISSKLDKDARYFHLNVAMWNGIHLSAGVAAFAAMLFIPIFWVGWPVGMILLAAPVLVYWHHRNANVPEEQIFTLQSLKVGERMADRRQSKAKKAAMFHFTDAGGEERKVPLNDDPQYPTHMLAEDLLGPALDARSDWVEVQVAKTGAAVSQMVDGIRFKREPVTPEAAVQAIDYIKDIAGLDVQDRRRRQLGSCRMEGPGGRTELSVTTAGSSSGQVLRVAFDRAKKVNRPFDQLGLLPSQTPALTSLIEPHDRHGIVLVGAPPTHGLTTTMYSLVASHDAFTSNIKTLEREVEMRIDGVDHVEWDATNPDIDFATNLQSMLRRDPDIVMIDFVKDRETAEAALDPGMAGPLIYVPQQAGSIAEQLRMWVKVCGDVRAATSSLRAVMNQRLMRTLCPNCKQAYQPTAEQLKKLNLPANKIKQLYQASGKVQVKNRIENCAVCDGRGYLGQTGIFEVFGIDDQARKALGAGDLKAALAHARRNKMVYLQEAALSKVASGETTIDEVVRVTAPAKAKGGEKAA